MPWRQEREAVRRVYCLTQPYHHRLLPDDVIIQTKGTVLLVCWYAFVAISKQCVNAFEICQGHLPT